MDSQRSVLDTVIFSGAFFTMRIGIDARLLEETGVGRYIRNLITHLSVIDNNNEYVVFLSRKSFSSFVVPNARWSKILAAVRWHTLAEQFVMPGLFARAKLDLVHIPYHNPPIFYTGPTVVTIHDLTILHFNTGKATTLPVGLYQLKRFGYWLELLMGLQKAKHVIAVSQTTKKEIMDHFHVPASKITVTYEGVDRNLSVKNPKRIIDGPYSLYVGNAYPHKNLDMLLKAWQSVQKTLVLVGGDDFFYRRLKRTVQDLNLTQRIIFFGPANDSQLVSLYAHADAFIFPSLMEGFGLPALEALSLGCPVLASDIPIFHEILGSYATYFNPSDPDGIASVLGHIGSNTGKPNTIHPQLQKFMATYSWSRMAAETLTIYERSARV